jgi:hypothetical protein
MSDTKKTQAITAAQFVEQFERMSPTLQDSKTYAIASRHAGDFVSPKNVAAMGIGIKLALLGEPLPIRCVPHWRKGFALGQAIRDGQLPFETQGESR